MNTYAAIGAAICTYLLGSIPFGLWVGRRLGVDVRKHGSGNIGATNVARNLGKKVGVLVLALDAAKALVPALLARYLVYAEKAPPLLLAVVVTAAVLGHCFSVFLKFRGGKGVATAMGGFLVVDPALTGMSVLLFIGVYAAFKIASLASITAALGFACATWIGEFPQTITYTSSLVAALIVFKHRSNLLRLFHGHEHRV